MDPYNKRTGIVDGKVIRLKGSLQDITELKLVEDELKKSKWELQRTLDATTDGIWSWDFKTNKLFFSPRYYTMLGYEPNAFLATYENWINLIHPDDREKAQTTAEEYLKTKSDLYENEFRLRTSKGDYRWIHTRARVAVKDDNGNPVYMIGNHQDITERKQAEEVTRKSESFLKSLLDAIPIPVFYKDFDGRYLDFNKSFDLLLIAA